MLRILMILSGGFELLFGLTLLVMVAKGVALSGATREQATVFGVFTIVLGLAALIMSNRLGTTAGMATAYGLWLYNVIAAIPLIYLAAKSIGGAPVQGGAAIHAIFAVLFTYALFASSASH